MWGIGAAIRLRGVFVAFAVGVTALALTPAVGLAHRAKAHLPRIYIYSGCQAQVAPRLVYFGCTTALGNFRETEAGIPRYRHYGTPVALASGTLTLCLEGGSKLLVFCDEGGPNPRVPLSPSPPPEASGYPRVATGIQGEFPPLPAGVSYGTYPAAFRFFDVVRCTLGYYEAPLLYYGKFSYKIAGRPWATYNIMSPKKNPAFIEGPLPIRCRPVRLPRR